MDFNFTGHPSFLFDEFWELARDHATARHANAVSGLPDWLPVAEDRRFAACILIANQPFFGVQNV